MYTDAVVSTTVAVAATVGVEAELVVAGALLRMEGLDFSTLLSGPTSESLANGNIMVFIIQYALQYILGT